MSSVPAERFFGNDHKALLEGELTALAHEYNVSKERALILCGFNAARHQRMARRWDEAIFAEIDKDRFDIACRNASGHKYFKKNGTLTASQQQLDKNGANNTPRKSVFHNADVFKVFEKYQSFGLIDLDFCCTVSMLLLLGVHRVIMQNKVDDKWALRVTISQRGRKKAGEFLCEQVQRMITDSSYKLVKEQIIRYKEPKKDSNYGGTPMMMIQWLMEPKDENLSY